MATNDATDGDLRPAELRPVGSLADISELLAGDTNRSKRFLGGLIAGALVGAAVAGSTLLRRRRGNGQP
jgi:hypothetical protein